MLQLLVDLDFALQGAVHPGFLEDLLGHFLNG